MRRFIVCVLLLTSSFFLNGCIQSALVAMGNNVEINPQCHFKKGQIILVKQQDMDRLEFGSKITDFFKNAGYHVVLAAETSDQYDLKLMYEYDYVFDVIHNTLQSLDIIIKDSQSNETLIDAHFQAFSIRSADGLLQSYLEDILLAMENPHKYHAKQKSESEQDAILD